MDIGKNKLLAIFIASLMTFVALIAIDHLDESEADIIYTYVDQNNGSDENDGLTPENACKTIDCVLNKIATVGTISIVGDYDSNSCITIISGKDITLSGSDVNYNSNLSITEMIIESNASIYIDTNIIINNCGTITVNGSVDNCGEIIDNGTITVNTTATFTGGNPEKEHYTCVWSNGKDEVDVSTLPHDAATATYVPVYEVIFNLRHCTAAWDPAISGSDFDARIIPDPGCTLSSIQVQIVGIDSPVLNKDYTYSVGADEINVTVLADSVIGDITITAILKMNRTNTVSISDWTYGDVDIGTPEIAEEIPDQATPNFYYYLYDEGEASAVPWPMDTPIPAGKYCIYATFEENEHYHAYKTPTKQFTVNQYRLDIYSDMGGIFAYSGDKRFNYNLQTPIGDEPIIIVTSSSECGVYTYGKGENSFQIESRNLIVDSCAATFEIILHPLWIGSKHVTGDDSGDGWTYKESTRTLVLENATIKDTNEVGSACIYDSIGNQLTIIIKGNNKILPSMADCFGIKCESDLQLIGTGSLITETKGKGVSIWADGLVIDGPTIDATGFDTAIATEGAMTIEDGLINAYATNKEEGAGICAYGGLTINYGTVNVSGKKLDLYASENGYHMLGGILNLNGSGALRTNGNLTMDAGTINSIPTMEGIYSGFNIMPSYEWKGGKQYITESAFCINGGLIQFSGAGAEEDLVNADHIIIGDAELKNLIAKNESHEVCDPAAAKYLTTEKAGEASITKEPETVIIIFDGNTGNGSMDPQHIPSDVESTLNKNTFTKDGSTFNCWNTKSDGTDTSYADKAVIKVKDTVKLYAQWTENPKHTVTYNLNGGSGDAPKQQSFSEGSTFSIEHYDGTREGYEFLGWNDGTEDYECEDNYVMGTKDVLFKAIWKKAQKELDLELTMSDYDYGSEPSTPVLKGNKGDGKVTFEYWSKTTFYESTKPPTKVGDYVVEAFVASTIEYASGYAIAEFSVKPVDIPITINQPERAGTSSIDSESFTVNNSVPVKMNVKDNVITLYTGATADDDVLRTITATSNSNYKFVRWLWIDSDGSKITQPSEILGALTISAEFVEKSRSVLKIDSTIGGSITANPVSSVSGGQITITVKPTNGYELESFKVNGEDRKASIVDGVYKFTIGDSDVSVTAAFKETIFKITYDETSIAGADNPNKGKTSYTVSDEDYFLEDLPDHSGYWFMGWFTEASYTNTISIIRSSSACDYTLYALWAKPVPAIPEENQIIVTSTDSDSIVITSDLGVIEKPLKVNLNTGSGVQSADSSVLFPENTILEQYSTISVIDTTDTATDEEGKPIAGDNDKTFEIKFTGINLDAVTEPIVITLPYTLPEGTDPSRVQDILKIYFLDESSGGIERIPMDFIGYEDGRVSFSTTHNSLYQISFTVPVTSVDITDSSISLIYGETTGLTAIVYPDDAANKEVVWTSSNDSIASVDETGKVTAGNTSGTATITCTSAENSDIKDTCAIKVSSGEGGGSGGKTGTVKYSVTINAEKGGKVNVTSLKVPFESPITTNDNVLTIGTHSVVATADNGYEFKSWSISSGRILGDTTIVATFQKSTDPMLASIAVKTAPLKTTYNAGEKFEATGLVITLTFKDSSIEDLAYKGNESSFSFTPSGELKSSDKSITISYGGKTVAQAISINDGGSSNDMVLYIAIAAVIILVAITGVFFLNKKKTST